MSYLGPISKNRRPQVYGVNEEIPDGIMLQLRHPLKGMPKPWWFLFHPFKSIKLIFSTAKNIIKSMFKSLSPEDICYSLMTLLVRINGRLQINSQGINHIKGRNNRGPKAKNRTIQTSITN